MLFLQEELMSTDDPTSLDFDHLRTMLHPDDIGYNLRFVKKVRVHDELLLETFCLEKYCICSVRV
jgi:hypothetical protein